MAACNQTNVCPVVIRLSFGPVMTIQQAYGQVDQYANEMPSHALYSCIIITTRH